MQKYLNTELDYDERLELIAALSDIARIYYDEPNKIDIHTGICYQLMELANVQNAYGKMACLMKEIGYSEDYFEGQSPYSFKNIYEWEPRAYMCLLLSEYLWASLDETEDTVEPELIVEQSTWDKIKSKVKSLLGT